MPIYEFKCKNCGRSTEHQLTIAQAGLVTYLCEKCNKIMERVISIPTIIFKGKGFPGNDIKKGD